MIITNVFDDFIICKPEKGILHVGAHLCEEKELYNSIGITDDNILWIEGNIDIIKTKLDQANVPSITNFS